LGDIGLLSCRIQQPPLSPKKNSGAPSHPKLLAAATDEKFPARMIIYLIKLSVLSYHSVFILQLPTLVLLFGSFSSTNQLCVNKICDVPLVASGHLTHHTQTLTD